METLVNPHSEDLKPGTSLEESPVVTFPAKEQLSLVPGEEKSLLNRWNNFKYRLKKREEEIELTPFWRGMSTPLAVVTSALFSFGVFIFGLLQFGSLPSKIPLYYSAADNKFQQADKSIILFFPVVYGILMTVCLRMVYEVFRYDPRLSNILSWVVTIVNLLGLIAVGQIYNLIRPL